MSEVRETGDRRQETGDRRQETGDRRQETGDRSSVNGVSGQKLKDVSGLYTALILPLFKGELEGVAVGAQTKRPTPS